MSVLMPHVPCSATTTYMRLHPQSAWHWQNVPCWECPGISSREHVATPGDKRQEVSVREGMPLHLQCQRLKRYINIWREWNKYYQKNKSTSPKNLYKNIFSVFQIVTIHWQSIGTLHQSDLGTGIKCSNKKGLYRAWPCSISPGPHFKSGRSATQALQWFTSYLL